MRTLPTCAALVLIFFGFTSPAHGQLNEQAPLLSLEEAIRIAQENNYAVRIARNEAEIARNNYTIGNAGYLPSVGLTAQNSQSALLRTRNDGFGSQNSVDMAAGLSMTLFDGMARPARYRRLEALSEHGAANAERIAEATLADVITLYYNVVRQQQQLAVQREAVAISEERVRIAELRRDLGSASELEVRRARVDLNADRAALLREETALLGTKAALNQILGREDNPEFRATDDIFVTRGLSLPALEQTALQQNKALRQAEQQRTVAEFSRQEVRAEWFPRLDLQVGYVFNDLTGDIGLPVTRPGGFSYGLTASFDLFDGFNRSRRMQNAQLDIQNTQLAIDDTRISIQTELEQAFQAYENSLALIDLEEENAALAQQNVEVALEQFELGTITSVELREVQTALLDANSRLVTARFEAKQAEIDLLHLSGQLLDAHQLN